MADNDKTINGKMNQTSHGDLATNAIHYDCGDDTDDSAAAADHVYGLQLMMNMTKLVEM